jgi:hypothetical protein
MPDSVNTDFVSFNYHRQNNARPRQAALDMWLAANALQEGEVKLTNRLATPMTYK